MTLPPEMLREINESRHGDSAMFYAKELVSLILAHHHIVMLSNTRIPGLSDEQLAQRKALLQVPAKIVRQEALRMMKDYLMPEWEKWLDATDETKERPA